MIPESEFFVPPECPKAVLLFEKSPTFHQLADVQHYFFRKQITDEIIFLVIADFVN